MISLDNIKMKVINTSPSGVVNEETIFSFSQIGEHIWAHYAGGQIRNGYLVGSNTNNQVNFSYCQQQNDGKLDHGVSSCQLSVTANNKIRLVERFEWREGQTGENIFEEL